MTTPIADAIRRIEDRIGDERYWCKGTSRDGNRRCIGSAAFEVDGSASGPTGRFLRSLLPDYSGYLWLPFFNDDPATTHADVMLFLATALDVAEAEGV